ncbi:unnamed protein product [Protopolystoma xenopodis]|uniref:Uncharacterized protein n=1 Tax=Protopolystoma xenopodis TaxID=117903 RepID=A0A3S5AL35_9PLAT|nr:unnamed protein product [Protopolystoma xenopodis]
MTQTLLECLQLEGCKLNHLPETIRGAVKLRRLYLADNYFRDIPRILCEIGGNLTHLDLSRNPLDTNCLNLSREVGAHSFMPINSTESNPAQTTGPRAKAGRRKERTQYQLLSDFGIRLGNLTVLKLSACQLTSLAPGAFRGLIKIKQLDLSKNMASLIRNPLPSGPISVPSYYVGCFSLRPVSVVSRHRCHRIRAIQGTMFYTLPQDFASTDTPALLNKSLKPEFLFGMAT